MNRRAFDWGIATEFGLNSHDTFPKLYLSSCRHDELQFTSLSIIQGVERQAIHAQLWLEGQLIPFLALVDTLYIIPHDDTKRNPIFPHKIKTS